MQRIFTLFIFIFGCFTWAFAQDGQLDPSFADDGILVSNLTGGPENGHGIVVQPDGKIVVAFSGGWPNANNWDISVIRLLEDGTTDSTFATDGVYYLHNSNATDLVYDIEMADDGSFYVCGSFDETNFIVIKLTPDGAPDASFGTDGISMFPIDDHLDYARGLAIRDDGKIVLTGYSYVPGFSFKRCVVARLNADGSLDDTFGTGGIFMWNDNSTRNELYNVEILDDGSIIVAGYSNPAGSDRHSCYKILEDGSGLDMSFGTNGEVLAPFEGKGYGMFVHSNGNIMITGGALGAMGNDLLVLAYNQDGTPNTDFGIDGAIKVDTDISDIGFDLAEQWDGKVIAIGETGGGFGGNTRSFHSVRMSEWGEIDSTWGENGVTVTDLGGFFAFSYAVAIMPDGRVLLTGTCAHTNNDLVVIRYGNAPPNNLPKIAAIDFKFYPNPVTDKIFIQSEYALNHWQITNLNGQLISRGEFLSGMSQYEISTDRLPEGSYVISVVGEKGLGSEIFLKVD